MRSLKEAEKRISALRIEAKKCDRVGWQAGWLLCLDQIEVLQAYAIQYILVPPMDVGAFEPRSYGEYLALCWLKRAGLYEEFEQMELP